MKTAVEWMVEQLPERMKNYLNDSIQEAKEMEKEQIIKAYEYTAVGTSNYGEQYYQETFKSDK
jgi:Tfp pilus assembly protein PilF